MSTTTAEIIGPVNPGHRGDQVLVRVGADYFVVSSIDDPLGGEKPVSDPAMRAIVGMSGMLAGTSTSGAETLVFPADAEGNITGWGEVAGGRGVSRDEAIAELVELKSA